MVAVAVFLCASARFCLAVAREDLAVGLVSPLYVLVRSLALGTGMSLGVLRGRLATAPEVRKFRKPKDSADAARESGAPRVPDHA